MKVADLLKYLLAIFLVGGIVVSVLAWKVHNSAPGEADVCSINEHWDCGTVQHSRYAELHGFPVAAIGVIGYTAMLIIVLLYDSRRTRQLLFAMIVGGMGFALYLTYIEDKILETWCLYCVISQALITLALITSGARLWLTRKDA
jgi:vitamin-K-epoxide reductase (warfarin-sensitive)